MVFEKAEKLAKDHWDYVKRVLEHSPLKPEEIEHIGFHYMAAFIHGYKHGKEE